LSEIEYPKIVTQDPGMLKILNSVKQTAKFGSSLMIIGESGTGKNLIARHYHLCSSRSSEPFIQFDCASMPSDLLETELLGHEKGAFTGAVQQRIGRFEAANNGTIFLDQIEELPILIQSKLTRVLQERCFERIGGNDTIHVDVQIVSATRNHLSNLIKEGLFREDLFFRLSIVPVNLPPLRARKGDIPLLMKHFLERSARKHDRPVPKLQLEALEMLCSYHWPGNVRELENLMERVIISCSAVTELTCDQIPLHQERISEATMDVFAEDNLSLEELEKIYIRKILQKVKGNKTKAAKILGINRKTLLEKRKRYNLK
jgi:transcriptional regulator with PAS, ATPase and Fis domain